jgi:hypothetical protein
MMLPVGSTYSWLEAARQVDDDPCRNAQPELPALTDLDLDAMNVEFECGNSFASVKSLQMLPALAWMFTETPHAIEKTRCVCVISVLPFCLLLLHRCSWANDDWHRFLSRRSHWANLNYLRLEIALAAWLAALNAFSLLYQNQV